MSGEIVDWNVSVVTTGMIRLELRERGSASPYLGIKLTPAKAREVARELLDRADQAERTLP